ncbi:MAG: hypothetical protein ACTS53_01645 [Candidatus Hodgkinia cicadicola]
MTGKTNPFALSLLERNLAYSLAWLSGIDILEHAMFSDGVFNVLRSALSLSGIIFTDVQSFQQLLCPNGFKHKVACINSILRVRSKTPCGPFNDVLAKLAYVLDPSSCVLALGTWRQNITNALLALRSNAIPSSAVAICPLSFTHCDVWTSWFDLIATSPTTQVCAIQTAFGGLDAFAIIFGILLHWAPPQMLALPAPQVPAS